MDIETKHSPILKLSLGECGERIWIVTNNISGLNINNVWCTDDATTLKREAYNFLSLLFQSNEPYNLHSLQLEIIPQIGQDFQNLLLTPVTTDEIKGAIFSMNSYKACGPDGFQLIFFKTYWHIVGHDVWKFVSYAFNFHLIILILSVGSSI